MFIEDVLSGFKRFVVKFMIRMSRVITYIPVIMMVFSRGYVVFF